ncbi:MAG: translation initiation factor IF-2 N-terminal domain-containing protein, partial [Muribaculaceae bacterium]|nr:translation initiation factor IF-2 N-terminal domain-containing protein [Muribaculaceae bacterium]
NKPRILGKIELDKNGMPVRQTPAPRAESKAEEKAAEAPAPKPEAPVQAPVAEKQPEAERPVKNENPQPAAAPQTEKPAAEAKDDNKNASTTTKPANLEVKPEKQKEQAAQKPAEAQQPARDPEVFVPERTVSGPSLNIIGKIDLDALNQSTRPKKKSNDRRGGRGAQQGGAAGSQTPGAAAGNGDRRKRRRIGGKEKVDVEKAGKEGTDNRGGRNGGNGGGNNSRNGGNGQNQQGGGRNARKDRNASRKPAPQHVEVSDEDVQKQVKETLARLTSKDKGMKKGAKWRKEKREANATREREAARAEQAESKVLKLTEFVTANDLAIMMDVPVNNVIATCMNIGVMVSINQRLDAETINIVADEFGFKTEYVSAEVVDAIAQDADDEADLVSRPPVVTVMGHVDHGKTSLLDYIRHANVIAGEAGGITQHIGSYSVQLADGRHITFLDTPGHEAFTAMRARGAKVTDICIIIVAADDSVMPQTIEAINHASAAGVPIVFAINKIDKPHANPEKIKEELAAMNYLVEDWGGKYQSQDISAKKGIGVEELMEKVLLEAEMLELKANPKRNATGAIIESTLDKGRGYV